MQKYIEPAGAGVLARVRRARSVNVLAAVMLASLVAMLAPAPHASAQDMADWQRSVLGMGSRGYVVGERSKGRVPRAIAAASESEVSGKPQRRKGKRVASLGTGSYDLSEKPKSLTGGGVRWVASAGCLASSLKSVIYAVASSFGPVTVSSTCRSPSRNRRAGGARRSYHLTGSAADFRVHANVGAVFAYLRSSSSVGGLKHYGGGLFHIDTGPRRRF